jgi:hypothetical protein
MPGSALGVAWGFLKEADTCQIVIQAKRKGRTFNYYLIKNPTSRDFHDQVLGDLEKGNRDPSLCLFPEEVTPNHHKLAREFVLLDNFYVEGEVSADGHEWTMGAYATDYVEKMWPMSYGHNEGKKYAYPSEGRFKIAASDGGYLWDRAREAGVSYRSYGEFVNNGATTNDPCFTMVPALQGHFDPGFRSFDVDYSDLARVDRFIAELKGFERECDMPRLQIVRLPNDHTAGTTVGKLTPQAYVAENASWRPFRTHVSGPRLRFSWLKTTHRMVRITLTPIERLPMPLARTCGAARLIRRSIPRPACCAPSS